MSLEDIAITDNIQSVLSRYIKDNTFSQIGVLVDENTREHCLPVLKNLVSDVLIIEIVSGELYKNIDTCQEIWNQLTRAFFDRHALFINLGGGVIGDMGGFCAATYKRGIKFINIPTTLLAQVDASVGGKLGIDFHGFKNHIGIFANPDRIFIDPVFLQTLPERELRSGFAEVIKHSLIADATYWTNISKHQLSTQNWHAHIQHSVRIKNTIVEKDPTETGLRKILNFGHTIGHAIETYYLENKRTKLLHGEAIAIGMICESYLSKEKFGLEQGEIENIQSYILSIFDKVKFDQNDIEPILSLCLQDKKNVKGTINFSLLEQIGKATYNIPVNKSEMKNALSSYLEII